MVKRGTEENRCFILLRHRKYLLSILLIFCVLPCRGNLRCALSLAKSMKLCVVPLLAAGYAMASGLAVPASANDTYTPVLLMHGINGAADDFNEMVTRLAAAHPGQELHALDVFSHALSFLPIWHQIPHITDVVRGLTENYTDYHLICHSQGGIVCRALIETMEDHRIQNFVSVAGVQQGVRAIPDEYAKFLPEWLNNYTDNEVCISHAFHRIMALIACI